MRPSRSFAEAVAPDVPGRHRPEWRRRGLFEGPVRKAAAITCVAVAAGFGLSTTLIGPQTPRQVASSYMEAHFDQDWSAVWALTCTSIRESTDFATFADEYAAMHEYYFLPSDVDVSIGDAELVRHGSGEYVNVPAKATSDEGYREVVFDGDLPLALEDGDFRVCSPSGASESP